MWMCTLNHLFAPQEHSVTCLYHTNTSGWYISLWRVWDSSVCIATHYGLDGPEIESRWGEIFHTRSDRPWGPTNLLYNGYRVFPGGKAARVWHWTLTPSSAEVEERVELYLYSPSGRLWPVLRWTLSLPYSLNGKKTSITIWIAVNMHE
jgi:hypothetical protein